MSPWTLQQAAAVVVVIAAVAAVARFEFFCLDDLAKTSDYELRYLPRPGWIAVIVLSIPLGGILYLYYGKVR